MQFNIRLVSLQFLEHREHRSNAHAARNQNVPACPIRNREIVDWRADLKFTIDLNAIVQKP